MTNNELEKGSSILFILMMLVNILNYGFQIVMGRMLDVEMYGVFNALFAIITILYSATTITIMFVSRYITYYNFKKEEEKIQGFLCMTVKYIIIGASIVVCVGMFMSETISLKLGIDNNMYLNIILIISGLGMIAAIPLGVMQGLKKFLALGMLNVIFPLIKFIVGVFLVFMGFDIYGILIGMIVGTLVWLAYGFWILHRGYYLRKSEEIITSKDKREMGLYALKIFICILSLSILSNIDMIFIKAFFSDKDAGIYSVAILFGRIILYIPSALVMAMFPLITEAKENAEGNEYTIIKKALLYGVGISLIAAVGLNIFKKLIIYLLMGGAYLEATKYILPVSIFILPLCLLTILMNYYLAISKAKIMIISLVTTCIVNFVMINRYHRSIIQVIYTLTIINSILCIINIIPIIGKKSK